MLNEKQHVALYQLRNTLFSIQVLARLLGETRGDGQLDASEAGREEAGYVGQIEGQVQAAMDLLGELEQPSAGPVVLRPRVCDLTMVARQVVAANQGRAAMRGVTLLLTTLSPCYAEVDVRLLREAFEALVGEALDRAPNGSSVWMSVRVDPSGGLCIDVRDEGLAFTQDDEARLFGVPMLSRRTPQVQPSAGHGLLVARRVAESHGGSLLIQGGGGRESGLIRIRLPETVVRVHEPPPRPPRAADRSSVDGRWG